MKVVEIAKTGERLPVSWPVKALDSDLDLLVIKPGEVDKLRVGKRIYRALIGVGQAVDVVVVTPEDVERYRDTHCLVIKPAILEGKVVYAV